DLVGLHQCGHFRRNIIQQQRPALRLLLAARAPLLPFLLSLKGLPILENGMRVFSLHVAEDMWVTGNELVAEGIENIVDGKMPGFLSHLRIEKDLQQQVTQLAGRLRPIAIVDSLQDFVGFFKRIALDGIEALLAIPRAASRSPQSRHNRDGLLEFLASGHRFNVSPGTDWRGHAQAATWPQLADQVGFYRNARSNVCNEPKSASNEDVNVSSTLPLRASPRSQQFDVLVIGGGINGVAIARECALNGKRTMLVEKHDFASGTTSRSTRIIHGGLRYLELGDIGLGRESLQEREPLLDQYPHLLKPLEFLLVAPKKARSLRRSSLAIRTGLWLYHRWAGRNRPMHGDIAAVERQLEAGSAWSIYSYEDAQCEFPERLTAEWLVESKAAGAVVCNHTRALEITRRNGHVTGARLRDDISDQEYEVAATAIVNATGPWADFLINASGIATPRMVGGVRGAHMVLPKFAGAAEQPIYAEAPDGRQIFVLPWNKQILVGTTEVADSDPDSTQPSREEIDYLMTGFLRLFPRSGLTYADIRYTFAGI